MPIFGRELARRTEIPETTSNKRPMIPAGEHFVTLKEVKELDVPAYGGKPGTERKWAWRFEADCLDPKDGYPYEHTVWTKAQYGGAKANLTKLLDMLIPKATKEQKQNLNTDRILERRFKTVIIHRTGQQGGMIAEASFFLPITTPMDPAERASAPRHEDDGDESGLGGGVDNDEDAMRSAAEASGIVADNIPI